MIIYIFLHQKSFLKKKTHLRQVFKNKIIFWVCEFKIHKDYYIVKKQVLRLYLNIASTTKFNQNRFILESITLLTQVFVNLFMIILVNQSYSTTYEHFLFHPKMIGTLNCFTSCMYVLWTIWTGKIFSSWFVHLVNTINNT